MLLLNAAIRPPDDAEVLFTETLPVCAIAVALPAASVNDPDVTVTTAVPPTDVAAVKVAVYTVLLVVWKLLSVPKVALMSANEKFDVASLAVNVTVEVPPELTDDGLATSITIAFASAMLLVPLGTVVDVIALPAVSRIVPIVKLETVKSEDDCPAPMVYVPVSEVPADAAVNVTVAPVSSVTVRVFPD